MTTTEVALLRARFLAQESEVILAIADVREAVRSIYTKTAEVASRFMQEQVRLAREAITEGESILDGLEAKALKVEKTASWAYLPTVRAD